jgi:hypothetical protein
MNWPNIIFLCRNPAQGFVAKIKTLPSFSDVTIHTFGFGYNLQSGLLKSIAEVGGGNYSFIPDAGMIVSICPGEVLSSSEASY